MKLAEIHCHTTYSNIGLPLGAECLMTPEMLLQTAKAKGLSAVAITDHDTMWGYREAEKLSYKYGITVIPAEEFDTDGMGQILAYGIKPGIKPKRSPFAIIKDIHDCGGIAIIAHPYCVYRRMQSLHEVIKFADGVEVCNFAVFNNNRALKFALNNKIKVRTGGSDAHHPRLVGGVAMAFPDNCQTVSDYLECLRKGVFEIKINISYYKALLIGGANLVYSVAYGLRHMRRFYRFRQLYIERRSL